MAEVRKVYGDNGNVIGHVFCGGGGEKIFFGSGGGGGSGACNYATGTGGSGSTAGIAPGSPYIWTVAEEVGGDKDADQPVIVEEQP